jgi:hypothetical protein
MVWYVEGTNVVVLHNSQPPTRSEWDAWMQLAKGIPVNDLRVLVFTDGGAPEPVQRKLFVEYLINGNAVISVISASVKLAALVTAVSWFSVRIKHFAPTAEGYRGATRHLGVSTEFAARALLVMRALSTKVDGGIPACLPAQW